VFKNEIVPTLTEYWYDNPSRAIEAVDEFLADLS
jgi:hypothetical protein